jgi:hypothetical protein
MSHYRLRLMSDSYYSPIFAKHYHPHRRETERLDLKQMSSMLREISKPWLAWPLLALIAVMLTLPVSLNGYLTGHDHHLHVKWACFFITQLWTGDLYPRWLMGMNAGQGSPVFFFYGPVAYWITALLPPWTGGTVEATTQQLGYSVGLAVFLSGVTMLVWLRREVGALPALVGSMAYMALPYHVYVDVYKRFAFSELWAFVWLPLLFLCADRIVRREGYGLRGFAVAYGLMVMTHLPSALICSPLPALYLLFRADSGSRVRALMTGAGAYLLGLGVSMIYLLPALTLQPNVDMSRELWTGFYAATSNFLFYGPRFSATDGNFWALLTQMSLITAGVGVLGSLSTWRTEQRKVVLFWLTMLLLALFMMHPLSAPIWRLASTLQAVQFPWRFNVVLTFVAAALFAYGFQAWLNNRNVWRGGIMAIILMLLLVIWPAQVKPMLWNAMKPFHPPASTMLNYFDADEYRPVWVPRQNWLALQKVDLSGQEKRPIFLMAGQGTLDILSWNPRDIRLHVVAHGMVDVAVRQFYFPEWVAIIDDGKMVQAHPSPEGWLSARLPDGEYTVRFVLRPLPVEIAGRWISCITLVLLAFSLLASRMGWRFRESVSGTA